MSEDFLDRALSAPASPGGVSLLPGGLGGGNPDAGPGAQQPGQNEVIWQVVATAANTALQRSLWRKGYIPPTALSDSTLSQVLLDRRKQVSIFNLLFSGLDNRPLVGVVDSVLAALGADPLRVPVKEKLNIFLKHAPVFSGMVYFLLGDKYYDVLFGKSGSPMLLAKGIMQAYGPMRMDGSTATRLALALHMAFSANPALSKGFSSSQLSKILENAVKSGILSPTVDANVFLRQVTNIVPMYAAVRDVLKQDLKRPPTDDELIESVPRILSTYSGLPFSQITKQLRKDLYIKSVAPGGLFQAGLQAAGIQVPISPEVYTKDDIALRQNVLDSPVGNIAGATARAVEVYGKAGPLGELYDSIRSGNMPTILPGQWVNLAVRSGIPPQVAMSLLHQRERNKAFITPDLMQGLRAAQFQYDIAPAIDQINSMYHDPELRAGALAEYAKRLGYKGVGNIDPGTYMMLLHSNAVHSGMKRVLQEADRFAAMDESAADMQGDVLRSVFQYARDTKAKKDADIPTKFNIADVIGAKPYSEFGVSQEFVYPTLDLDNLTVPEI